MVIHLSYILMNLLCVLYTNGQIVIKDAGTSRIQPTDIGMIFYLTLENICPSEMYISVRGVKCCEVNSLTGRKDCDSMKLIGGDPGILCAGKTKNVTLIYPNLYLYGRQGVCTVLVVFKVGMVTDHFFRKIPFNTKGCFQDLTTKKCPCYTSDLDPFRNCSPVDCPIKYSGYKNFFNSFTKYCEPVPFCKCSPGNQKAEQMYDLLHNRCVDLQCTVTSTDLSLIEAKQISSEPVPYLLGNILCHHGCIDKRTGECICNNKWVSSVSNEPEFVPSLISSHMCNIRTGSWTEINKDKLLLTILVMVVMTSLCVIKLFVLICILHFCYKWARSKAIGERINITESGFERDYGTMHSHPCSKCTRSSSRKSRKSSGHSKAVCEGRCDKGTHIGISGLLRTIPKCSQSTLARIKLKDKCLQLNLNRLPPHCSNVGVTASVECPCNEQITNAQEIRAALIETDHSGPSIRTVGSEESLLSDETETGVSSSICSCTSTDESMTMYRNDDMTYFASTPTTGPSSTPHPTGEQSSGGTETTTQAPSNFSINMEYDSDDLELECSSSSDK